MPHIAALLPVCLLLGLAATAGAQDSVTPADGGVRITVTKAECRRLVKHVPAPDATYRPGVDVNGDPVVPADLGGGVSIDLPETFTIPIEVDLFDRFGIPADAADFNADQVVGEVVVDDDGRAYFNEQPLQDEEAADLATKCQEILRGAE